jgi:hypothetical protein|tara:strand:+ start:802 stop:951 length:150 start_codon:yes stop_codon:yes gene_type:complete
MINIARRAVLDTKGETFYVQNIDQKVVAILAGIGKDHLPLERIKDALQE